MIIQSYKFDTKIKINAISTFIENLNDSAKKIFFEFKNFDDVFSLKNEKILANYKEYVDHIIELKNDKQLLYTSLYNLFNFELKTLRLYLDDALTSAKPETADKITFWLTGLTLTDGADTD